VCAEAPRGALRAATDSLGIYFEPNLGQTDPSVHYLVRAEGYTAFLTDDGAVFAFDFAAGRASGLAAKTESGAERGSDVLRMSVVGADTAARLVPERPVAGVSNYLVGPDETAWLTGVPHFGSVRWAGVYDGVDLRFHGNGRLLEYDFEVAPGADASRIRVRFEGQQAATVDEQGDLVLRLAGGDVVQPRAYVYQGAGESRREVASRFELDADGSVAVALDDDYDRSAPLVIDPTVGPQPHPATVNSNDYLGGRDDETAGGIAVDASGAVYVAGNTRSGNFPTTSGSFDRSSNGGADVFVTKLSAGGGSLVYSTFIGGTGDDAAYAIAVDSWHTVFMTGATRSADFPTTPGSYDGSYAGSQQAFVTRLSANGDSLVYSTFLGGSETQTAYGLTLDGAGAAYVTGETNSDDFPTTPGAYDRTPPSSSFYERSDERRGGN
jgi:hypothetical protein